MDNAILATDDTIDLETRSASPTRRFRRTRTTFTRRTTRTRSRRGARGRWASDGEVLRRPGDLNEDGHGATSIDMGSGGEGNAIKKTRP